MIICLKAYVERSLLPGVALATMLVKPILYLTGRMVSDVWFRSSLVNPDRNRHFPEKQNHQSVIHLCSKQRRMYLTEANGVPNAAYHACIT